MKIGQAREIFARKRLNIIYLGYMNGVILTSYANVLLVMLIY